MVWIVDLDGVVWLADAPVPGAAEAIVSLRSKGHRVVFASNNSFPTVGDYEAKLARHGIDAGGAVVTSAVAAATLIRRGERVLVCGGPGIAEAVGRAGAEPVPAGAPHEPGPVDAVVVGLHRDFDYERLRRAATAVRSGARLIATNDDATFPTPAGPVPGAGSILAAVERASGMSAAIAGKPHAPLVHAIHELCGPLGVDDLVVGDRPDTDGLLARALGCRFALVLTGVTDRESVAGTEPSPDLVAEDLGSLVTTAIGGGVRGALPPNS